MDEMFKAITKLKELFKAVKEQQSLVPKIKPVPSIKLLTSPSITSTNKEAKIPGINPDSKKDPKKVAQQIKDGSMSTKTQKIMLKADGQWSDSDISKADQEAGKKLYHIHQNGYQITDTPLSLEQIKNRHGGVQRIENAGFRLIPHVPKPEQSLKLESYKKNKEKLK